MNPLTNVKNIKKLSEQELISGSKSSWHDEYKDSAWIFIGGLPYDLTEGDIICVFSQYGEVVNINLVRDKGSGKSKGYCFLCYEDQRSTILAVDNLNSIKVLNRTLRVDHVKDYKTPKDKGDFTAETTKLLEEGCATTSVPVATQIKKEPVSVKKEPLNVKTEPPSPPEQSSKRKLKSKKKEKKHKKSKKKKKKDSDDDSDSSSSSSESD